MKLSLIAFLLVLTSCGMFTKQKPQNFEILTGEVNPDQLSPEEIKSELMQKDTMAMRSYEIKIYPLIDSYLKRAEIEQDLLKDLPKTQERTCFITEMRVDSHNKKTADFKTWKAEAINHEDEFIHMEWTPLTAEKEPVVKQIPGYAGKDQRLLNKGVLCAVDKLTTNKYFQVRLSPQVVQWPLKEDITFTWNVPETKTVDGKVIKTKRKKKIQRYKGW